MKIRNKKGFTLIELIVVIVIIGILAAVAVPAFVNLVSEAQAGATKGALGAIRSALVMERAGRIAGDPSDTAWAGDITSDLFEPPVVPTNPITNQAAINDVSAGAPTASSDLIDTASGWHYDSTTGRAWASIEVSAGVFSDAISW